MKTAVITGGASGIGKRTVERLLEEGWAVWSLDLSRDVLEEQARNLNVSTRLGYQACDVSNAEAVQGAFSEIAKAVQKIDALICCAGVISVGSLEETTNEQVDRMLAVNVKGPWLTVKEALPLLRKDADTSNPSRVVIIGSISGIRPKVGSGFYGASKAAVHVIAGVMAAELAHEGILVNAVAPGTIATPMIEAVAKIKSGSGFSPSGESPLGRVGQPNDVVDVIRYPVLSK